MEYVITFFRDILDGSLYIVVSIVSGILICSCIGYLAEQSELKKKKKEENMKVSVSNDFGTMESGITEINENKNIEQSTLNLNYSSNSQIMTSNNNLESQKNLNTSNINNSLGTNISTEPSNTAVENISNNQINQGINEIQQKKATLPSELPNVAIIKNETSIGTVTSNVVGPTISPVMNSQNSRVPEISQQPTYTTNSNVSQNISSIPSIEPSFVNSTNNSSQTSVNNGI